jgi:hypothetical protein
LKKPKYGSVTQNSYLLLERDRALDRAGT